MKRKTLIVAVKKAKPTKKELAKFGMTNAIEMKLTEIKTDHIKAEAAHKNLSIFRYAL